MRKLSTLLLALVLALSIAMPALAVDVQVPLTEEPVTFRIMVRKEDLSQNTWPEKECVQYTEKQTGIHIEWIEVPSSGWTEKVNLTFASGNPSHASGQLPSLEHAYRPGEVLHISSARIAATFESHGTQYTRLNYVKIGK